MAGRLFWGCTGPDKTSPDSEAGSAVTLPHYLTICRSILRLTNFRRDDERPSHLQRAFRPTILFVQHALRAGRPLSTWPIRQATRTPTPAEEALLIVLIEAAPPDHTASIFRWSKTTRSVQIMATARTLSASLRACHRKGTTVCGLLRAISHAYTDTLRGSVDPRRR